MAPSYPCIQCLFCKQLFASSKSLNSHLDHYLPEYCAATGAPPRRTAQSSHPIAAIRSVRSDASRTYDIRWKPDTVRPPDGVMWSFAVPVPSKAVKNANARGGLKSAAWWLKYLRAIPIPQASDDDDDDDEDEDSDGSEDDDDDDAAATSDPSDSDLPPPLPKPLKKPKTIQTAAAGIGAASVGESSRDGAARGALTGHAGFGTRVDFPGATGGGFDANGAGNLTVNIAGKTLAATDKGKGKATAKAAAYEVIDLTSRTPSPRARTWRTKTPPRPQVRFRGSRLSSSPFLLPSAPPVLFKLQISFLADTYAVDVSRRTTLADAMACVIEAFGGAMLGRVALAPKATGDMWSAAQWEELKSAAMFADGEDVMEAVLVKVKA